MPKLKSHSGAKKRIKKTASGKMKRKKTGGRHLLLGKSHSRLRRRKGTAVVENALQQRLEKLLPYA